MGAAPASRGRRAAGAGPRDRTAHRRRAAEARRVIAWSAHLSMLFTELPPLERPAAARAAGFGRAETWWPPAEEPAAWAAAVRAAGLRATIVNADGGDLAAGERGFCNLPERADEVVRAMRA